MEVVITNSTNSETTKLILLDSLLQEKPDDGTS